LKVYVTGASGFIGGHVARELRERGAEVRDEFVELGDAAALERAVDGCEAVVHVAALYSFDAPEEEIERVNVEGTRNVLEACARRGVRRLVFTSSSGTCGPVPGREATEADSPPAWELGVPYKRTKLAAERLVLGSGLDACAVNPTTPVGDGYIRPTPTGQMIDGLVDGRIRGYLAGTGINVVDVRDVARGHALALERGRAGERYILGGENLGLRELFARVCALAGRPAPRLRLPYRGVAAAARLGLVNRHEIALARIPMWFSSAKARAELGYEPGPVGPALERAVREALSRVSLGPEERS
jgi:dihydroflavonol-4-reductase